MKVTIDNMEFVDHEFGGDKKHRCSICKCYKPKTWVTSSYIAVPKHENPSFFNRVKEMFTGRVNSTVDMTVNHVVCTSCTSKMLRGEDPLDDE